MSQIVLDASTTLAWCFPDEQTPSSLQVLERLKEGDQLAVPFFWCIEVLNSLLVGEKRGRISAAQSAEFLDTMTALSPVLDYASMTQINGPVQGLCRAHGLSPYDALYVELAMRLNCPLATQDQVQKKVAQALRIVCL